MVPLRWSLKQLGLATSATMWTWLVGASFEYTMATQRKTIKLRIRLEFTLTSVCVCVFVSATSDRFSPVWRFRPYKPYIFWKLIIWWWPRPRQRHAKRRKTDTDKDKKCASNIQRMLYFYRTQVSLGSGLWVPVSVCHRAFWNFADVTLANDDTNSILTDNGNRAIWNWWS